MSQPREVLPGSTYLISRRCTQRQFLLRPSELTNQIFAYCLALAAERTGVILHAVCVLSTHWHGVASDPQARLPEFLEYVHRLVAKAVNASLDRWENLWSSEAPSYVRLEDDAAILDKIVYTLANPVEAGLVSHGDDWPGLRTNARQVGLGMTQVVKRPKVFFRQNGRLPESVELRIVPPAVFTDRSAEERASTIAQAVELREQEIRKARKAVGRTFLGADAAKRVRPFDSPKTEAPRRGLSPRVAAGNPELRVSAIKRLKTFLAEYRDALRRWRDGLLKVVFPRGTYALRRLARVACAEPTG